MDASITSTAAGGGGIDGNTYNAVGGLQTTTISSIHIPNYELPVTDPGHTHGTDAVKLGSVNGQGIQGFSFTAAAITAALTGITVNSGGGGQAFPNLPPGVVAGIRMIRAV